MSEEDNQILLERRSKLNNLRDHQHQPFPGSSELIEYTDNQLINDLINDHASHSQVDQLASVNGRVIAKRGHGQVVFCDIRDFSGSIQVLLRADNIASGNFEMIGNLDLGDLIAVKGTTTVTPRGEFSIEVNSWQMLAKSLRPPPDKRAGLEDRETRYRQRELDLIANLQSREKFVIRSKTITALRNWLDQQQFLEVETPVLQPLYGGAAARPFTTHHNTLDRKLFLRIATELYLKRCIVGGFDRVYEIGKDFRNEGLSTKHNPEFTMLEYYQAYSDYHQTADQFQRMISDVAEQVLGSSTLTVAGNEIDLGGSWKRITLRDAIMQETGHDIYLLDSKDKLAAALDNDNSDDNENQTSWAKMVDQLFSRHVEPKLIQPTFITDYPKEMSPFAKQHPEREDIVERWEAFIGGIEIANSFSELNDPDEQRQRFQQQAEDIADGDDEAQPYDQDFVRALEHGMPPTGGVGLGIDRLVMLLTDSSSLREVILFPVMR